MADPPVYTVTIDATPDQVWPLVGDLDREGEWSPKPYRVEWQSGKPNAVGSTFRLFGWPGKRRSTSWRAWSRSTTP